MTLATVPRYRPEKVSESGDHAVVVGGSMAGLLAARVLADAFGAVTVLDRDPFPDEPIARKGVPQARHFHTLLEAGRATLEDLFPGFCEDLIKNGAVKVDASREVKFHMEGDFLAEGPHRLPIYLATRPLYEYVVGQHIAAIDDIHVWQNCQFIEYFLDDTETRVTGVRVQPVEGQPENLPADLVVDATGRTSRTPTWLDERGYPTPRVDEVHVDVTYSTTFVDRPEGERQGITLAPSPDLPRGGVAGPVEGNRWILTLWGVHGDAPPTDPDGFEAFADSLAVPHLKRLLDQHQWRTDDIARYPFPSNIRRRYEALDRFPEDLIILGDAVASFNPIYGQGMSVAALEALQLHHSLAANGTENLSHRYFDRIGDTVDVAWNLAAGSDHQYPQTEGPKPRGTDILNWYLARYLRRAQTDGTLYDAFFRVQAMEDSPTSLLRPGLIWRVFKPTA